MLTWEESVEATALYKQGWTISAIVSFPRFAGVFRTRSAMIVQTEKGSLRGSIKEVPR